jgi:hypothetical protein
MFVRVAGPFTIAAALFCVASAVASPVEPAAGAAPTAHPAVSPSPSPSPGPTKAPKRFSFTADGFLAATDQQFVGPGTKPVVGPLFASGSPVAPNSPYDLWSGAPLVTGIGFVNALIVAPTYVFSKDLIATVNVGYGTINGNGNVAQYWGYQSIPPLNGHDGARYGAVGVAFPTHNGTDPETGSIVSVLSGSLHNASGTENLRGGWFDLNQTEKYVFDPAPEPNTPPTAGVVDAESIGDGAVGSDYYQPPSATLPLHGGDFTYKHDTGTYEVTVADLPTVPQTAVHLTLFSANFDESAGTRYGFAFSHAQSDGAPIETSTLYGGVVAPGCTTLGIVPSYLGGLASSCLGGQVQTSFGGSANFPIGATADAAIQLARSSYAASGTIYGGDEADGDYYYARIHQGFSSFDLTGEAVRFDPEYAPLQVPYGIAPENLFSLPSRWPSSFLKSTYQLSDTSVTTPNRQGFRISGSTQAVKTLNIRLQYGYFQQVAPYDTNAYQPGFIDTYFTPQYAGGGTFGKEAHYAANLGWHPKFADVSLDLTDVVTNRAPSALKTDAVSMEYPSEILTVSRQLNRRLFAAVGAGRTAEFGAYNTTGLPNVDLTENVFFAGLDYGKDDKQIYHLGYRLYSANGIPSTCVPTALDPTGACINGSPIGNSPAFHGPQVTFSETFRI